MNDLEGAGYAVADIVLAAHQCEHIASALPAVAAGRGGLRHLIGHPTVLQLLQHERLGAYLWSVVGRDLVAVKATLFDKTQQTNWRAQWHQDRTISVREKLDVAGYAPWSAKSGVPCVDAPAEVLAQMLAVRIHLDDCGADNGPLRVIPGSHQLGKLDADELQGVVEATPVVEVYAPQGAIVLMRPLLVHASTAARNAGHRRVLHIEFAPPEAISPLQWHATVPLRRAPEPVKVAR
jgi:ectoine hydroxylase-related dioxygenase (phytanoyl-CoA dioxygenase family)